MLFAFLAICFVVVPLIEIYLIIQVGQEIGALNTIALLVVISIFGAWLAKREGMSVIVRIRDQVASGQVPANELIDGACILVGGTLLLLPGFFSDVFGLLLLLPPTRAVVRRFVRRRFRIVTVRRFGTVPGRGIPPDDVIDV